MLTKKNFKLLILALLWPGIILADEGMWLLSLVKKYNIEKMQQMGFKLSADDIYSVNNASIKDAIVSLDYGGCTAEIVSSKGLLFTNHHCGYDEIQAHSSLEHDYLKYGFWSQSLKEELANPGKTATFLVRMEDVTEQVMNGINTTTTGEKRAELMDLNMAAIKLKATEGSHYEAFVESFFEGNQFFLFVTETFKDVRLVGTPPESIGKFGHDTDNWMYPRHTGDFSIFRVYMSPDGKPAEYSEKNIPYQPKKHLQISLKGVNENDFAMILGYPGTTNRYLHSAAIKIIHEIQNPVRVEVRTAKQDILKKYMNNSAELQLKYSAKFANSSNYWKYSIGQNKGIISENLIPQKKAIEQQMQKMIDESDDLKLRYADIINELNYYYFASQKAEFVSAYLDEAIFGGSDIIIFAYNALELYADLAQKSHKDSINKRVEKFNERAEKYFADFDANVDKEVLVKMLKMYSQSIEKELQADIMLQINESYQGNIQNYANELYTKSIFADKAKLKKFLKKPKMEKLTNDPGFILMVSFLNNYQGVYMATEQLGQKKDSLNQLFVALQMELFPEKTFYPDANSTMRLSYGKVSSYMAKDGIVYEHFTTHKGILEKEDPNNPEFVVDPKLKELLVNKDFGVYADKDGSLHVCFITDNDITGGNSGSPTLNANGELIGLAFDGNWEAMSSDLSYIPKLQRTIVVDIRYVLFVIDKFAGAKHLIDELDIVKE
jgi:hypothetical protein